MVILSIDSEIITYLKKHKLSAKFNKQCKLFLINPKHPSLNVEVLEPKQFKIYSFRIDKKYRAIFIFRGRDMVEILEVNNHYR